VAGHGCDFWKSCLAVELRLMRPWLSRTQVEHFEDREPLTEWLELLRLDESELEERALAAKGSASARISKRDKRCILSDCRPADSPAAIGHFFGYWRER
jgi:hypothetical protein